MYLSIFISGLVFNVVFFYIIYFFSVFGWLNRHHFFVPQVECPDDLYNALVTTWDTHPQYDDVCNIIVDAGDKDEEDEEEEEEGGGQDDATLLHTFYRWGVRLSVDGERESRRGRCRDLLYNFWRDWGGLFHGEGIFLDHPRFLVFFGNVPRE